MIPSTVIFGSLLVLGGPWPVDGTPKEDKRAKTLGAFSRGENLSWDQLELVASEAGLSREKIAEIKLKERLEKLIAKLHLRLEVSGFSEGMEPDEEFRLYKGHAPGTGALLFNSAFWSQNAETLVNDPYLVYLLFRAEAYYLYLSHYDAEHCAWIVEENSPSMEVLKTALDGSAARWVVDAGPLTTRDIEFRQSLVPHEIPSQTLKALIEYALRTIAQKASDDWAEIRYRHDVGGITPLVAGRIRLRERALAADFNRARSAMTKAERVAFQKLLKSPFRYARRQGTIASEPVFDPAVKTP